MRKMKTKVERSDVLSLSKCRNQFLSFAECLLLGVLLEENIVGNSVVAY